MAVDVTRRVRVEVAQRAQFRCEYCLIHEDDAGFPHQVDHILSRKHGRTSELGNLAYCWILCNRAKGSDVASIDPITRAGIRLFDPRRDQWDDHFRLEGAIIEPLTAIGEATTRVLRLNVVERVVERRALITVGRYP